MSNATPDVETHPPRRKGKVTGKDVKAALSTTNLAAPTLPGGTPPAVIAEIPMASTIRLTLDQIEPYNNNPRTWRNEKYLEIRGSIKSVGLQTTLWVTRRPGEKKWVLARGGGTRYAALRSLYQETSERRFFEIDCNVSEYQGEIVLQAAHLSENIHRSDLCFWDKAGGTILLKDEIEQEAGELTYKDTIEKFKELGLPEVARSLLALYQFAIDKLHALDSSVYGLSIPAVRDVLQPGYNLFLRLTEKAQYADFDTKVWQPALNLFGQVHGEGTDEKHLDWPKLMAKVDEALAAEIELPVETVRQMLRVLKQNQNATWDELQPPAPTTTPPSGGEGGNPPAGLEADNTPSPGSNPAATGIRVRQSPGTFAPKIQPEDGDRPPASIVEQVEAEQRRRAAEASGTQSPITPPSVQSRLDVAGGVETDNGSIELNKRALHALAVQLASRSKTLDGMIVQRDDLPMGWMVDLPDEVIASGTALPPLAKQIFWFLARASFQIYTSVNQPARIAGTRFAEFLLAAPATQQWSLIQPEGGFDFLMAWLIDPEHAALASPGVRMLTITRDLLANHPDAFLDLGHTLEFQDLQESHQARRLQLEQEALDYYVQNGASPEMVRRLFPHADLSPLRFRPGRVAEIDLKTAQRLYDVWDDLCQEIASDRQRYIRLHQVFPDVSMASLYSAINDLG